MRLVIGRRRHTCAGGWRPAAGLRRFALLLTLLAHALTTRPTQAADKLAPPGPESWPSFRNGNAQLGVAKTTLPKDLELLWTYKTGQPVYATAAIVGDHVYAASISGELFCLKKSNGDVVWTYKSRSDLKKPDDFIPGFKSAPTVTADTLYIGDEEGWFHAVDRQSGKKKWTFVTKGEIVGSATQFEDKLVIGSHDNSLYCLNTKGERVWQFVTENMVNCSPAISGNTTFIAGCDEHLRAIEIPTKKQISDIPLGTYLIASPAVIGDILYVGSYAGEVVAMDWRKKEKVWTYKPSDREFPIHSSAAVNDKYVIVGGQDKQLHCIHRQTGKKAWIFKARGQVNSSPVIVGDRVFVGSNDGNLYGINIDTGTEVFRFTDGRPFSASPAVGDGVLVVGSENDAGPIYCFGAKPAKPEPQK